MAELVIPIREFIGESEFNWDTLEMEWGTNADDLRMAVQYGRPDGQPVTSICLEVGVCYGGSTFAGVEMYNYLQSLGLPVRTRILSLAASMMTALMLVGTVEMDQTAQLMVHAPSMETKGTAAQIRAQLAGLDVTHEGLRDIYVTRTGQTAEVVEEWMSKDTWLTAAQAQALGLCDTIVPIAPAGAKTASTTTAKSARSRIAGIVARADKRVVRAQQNPKPKASTKAARAATSPRPMAKTPPKAAPRAAANPAAATAQQKANAKIVADLAKSLGVKAEIEGAEAEPQAVVEGTVLADGAGTLYTDGVLAQGSAVFNDEALTVVTDDAEYEAEDGRIITVAGGVVESITEAEAEATTEAPAGTEAIVAAINNALAPLTTRLDGLEAKFNKALPATPRARVAAQGPDAKTGKPKPRAAHHSTM